VAAPSFTDMSLAVGSKIGRHFSIVGMLPALFLSLWISVLISSDAWRTRPDLKLLGARMSSWSLTGVAWLLVATLLIALFLHPLQYAMTQVLEGYWGSSRVSEAATHIRISHHRRRRLKLAKRRSDFEDRQEAAFSAANTRDEAAAAEYASWDAKTFANKMAEFFASKNGDAFAALPAVEAAARKSEGLYPSTERIMPTRLGNALRRAEDTAGEQYGLDAILTTTLLNFVAAERRVQYVRDSRQQLDTTIRLCVVSLIAFVLSVASLLTDGLWLFVALGPYGFTYLAYRASIAAAEEYTTAVNTVITLDRFALYESLHVDPPRDTREERAVNKDLMKLLEGDDQANVHYTRPPGPPRKRRLYPSRHA
jgi:hypothetical protein